MKKLNLWPVVFYVLVLIFVFGRSLFPASDQLLYGDDVHRQYYFFRVYFLDSLREGIIPWWNPYVFSGVPFLANAQVSMQYPLNWLYVLLPLNIAYSWFFALHIFIAMISMYWFMRKVVSPFPAWVSGLIFGLSGYFFARTLAGQPDVVASAAYVPLVIGLFYELMRSGGRKNLVLAALGLGWQALVGYQIVTLFTLEAVGIIMIVQILSSRPKRRDLSRMREVISDKLRDSSTRAYLNTSILRMQGISRYARNDSIEMTSKLGMTTSAIVLGLSLAAVQILPAIEFFRRSIRSFDLPYSFAGNGAINWKDLLTLFNPYALGDHLFYTGSPPNWHEHQAFVGVTALVLALAGLVYIILRRPKSELDKLVGIGLIGFMAIWLSFAHNAPFDLYYLLWKIVPMYHYIRIPSRQLILFVFALSALCGYTISLIKPKLLRLFILGAILFELLPFAQRLVRLEKTPQTRYDQELVKLLQSEKEPVRITPNFGVWLPPRDALDFQSPMQYRYFSTTGYDPTILKNYYEFIDAINGKAETSVLEHNVQVPYLDEFSPFINFLNIKYFLNPVSSDRLWQTKASHYSLVKENVSAGYRLYENKNWQPRFFLIHDTKVLPTREAAAALIRSRAVNLESTVLFTQSDDQPPLLPCSNSKTGQVKLLSYQVNSIKVEVDTPCPGYLVSSEVWYPGWKAKIDEKPGEVFEANLAFRSVYVPKGIHTITMYYLQTVFIIGAAVSIVSLIVCFILLRNK